MGRQFADMSRDGVLHTGSGGIPSSIRIYRAPYTARYNTKLSNTCYWVWLFCSRAGVTKNMEAAGERQLESEAYDNHGFLVREGDQEEEDGRVDRCQGCW